MNDIKCNGNGWVFQVLFAGIVGRPFVEDLVIYRNMKMPKKNINNSFAENR